MTTYPQALERLKKADTEVFRSDEHGLRARDDQRNQADVAVAK
jgi:hypothetical protein